MIEFISNWWVQISIFVASVIGGWFLGLGAVLMAIIIGAFKWGIGGIIAWLGITYIGYQGFQNITDYIYSNVQDQLGMMPQAFVQICGLLKVDLALNIIFNAYAVRLTINRVWQGYSSISFLSFGKGTGA